MKPKMDAKEVRRLVEDGLKHQFTVPEWRVFSAQVGVETLLELRKITKLLQELKEAARHDPAPE